ncbi:hypothetical protein Salat_0205200 [Sesamum alatum]|uniref:RNase H type-1 domain-containing protein n=1 Tax=Sesamum alatum TaxID=300844 RepID=A0AAE2CXZ8_9LAMI|nr:hypothetical protein Salat_0205200 [Sesamum alatum]
MVTHLPALGSDHSPLIVNTEHLDQQSSGWHRGKVWRFEAMWLRTTECERVVLEAWQHGSEASNTDNVFHNLENCRIGFIRWNQDAFGNLRKRIKKLEEEITQLQSYEATEELSQDPVGEWAMAITSKFGETGGFLVNQDSDLFLCPNTSTLNLKSLTLLTLSAKSGRRISFTTCFTHWILKLSSLSRSEDTAILTISFGTRILKQGEDLLHTFIHCHFSRHRVLETTSGDVESWVRHVCDNLDTRDADRFLVLCWSLWNNRNKKLMEGKSQSTLLAWRMRNFKSAADPLMAKALAAKEALELSILEGWRNIILEGDCQTIITRMQTTDDDNSVIGPVTEDIRHLMRCIPSCRVEYIPRDINSVAHKIARGAARNDDGRNQFPSFIM